MKADSREAYFTAPFSERFNNSLITDAWTEGKTKSRTLTFSMGDPITICFQTSSNNHHDLAPGFGINNSSGTRIASLNTYMKPIKSEKPQGDKIVWKLAISGQNLMPGVYSVDISLTRARTEMVVFLKDCMFFEIFPSDIYGTGVIPESSQGVVYLSEAEIIPTLA
jgi:hypothetical protein